MAQSHTHYPPDGSTISQGLGQKIGPHLGLGLVQAELQFCRGPRLGQVLHLLIYLKRHSFMEQLCGTGAGSQGDETWPQSSRAHRAAAKQAACQGGKCHRTEPRGGMASSAGGGRLSRSPFGLGLHGTLELWGWGLGRDFQAVGKASLGARRKGAVTLGNKFREQASD